MTVIASLCFDKHEAFLRALFFCFLFSFSSDLADNFSYFYLPSGDP